jgi:hypothetical protein
VKALLSSGLALLALTGAAFAAPPCCVPCVEAPCTADKIFLKADVCEQKYTEQAKVINLPAAVIKQSEKEVSCVRKVPVCVIDPCTGCKRTEWKEEPYKTKVKCWAIEIIPPAEECTYKPVEKTKRCVTISIEHRPVPCQK